MQSGMHAGDYRKVARVAGSGRRTAARVLRVVLALLAVSLGNWAIEARAQSGGTTVSTAGAGLSFKIDTRWLDGGGYRPIKVTITPATPTTADRTISIDFVIRGHLLRSERHVFESVEIPAGSAGPMEVCMAIPGMIATPMSSARFLEDGEEIATTYTGGTAGGTAQGLPGMLIVSESALSTAGLAAALSVNETTAAPYVPAPATPSKPGASKPAPELPTAITRSAAELPRRWIEYTNCDLICLSLDEFHQVKRQNPEAFQAILAWTSAGGNLLVYGMQDDWSRLSELESLLKLTPKKSIPAQDSRRGWTEPNKSDYGRPIPVTAHRMYGPSPTPPRVPSPTVEKLFEKGFAKSKLLRSPPFLMREYDMGMVVAIADDAPLPGSEQFWNWLLNSLTAQRWDWTQRHGLSALQTNVEFWNFQIPGVGLPPVNAFRVLITLFVVAIGPLNYWLLRRRRRLQLLVVTIPLGAAAVTLVLFGYALVADGLGTRVRVRSATLLDQRHGRAACWARMMYYSGVTPFGGLTFPADVAVLPFDFVPGESGARRQDMIWEDDQRLVSGWLPARTPTQLLTLRSRATEARLDIAPPGKDAAGLEVTNRLGTRVESLVVCAEDGKCYTAEGIDPGAKAQLQEVAAADARTGTAKAYHANKLGYPPGLDPGRLQASSYRGYSRRYRFAYGVPSTVQATQDTGRLEQALSALDPARSSGRPLPPRSYLAIVEQSPEVVLGTPRAREEASFHVIRGTW